ncbi:response regulator transcription factor [Halobacillus shinanisalinarum]|uniref:Response regulator transcription factor n=1 Tax=Halobacillus shinanisalinarum TaxID=2932258 RepID=A0ABY4H0Q4_9BACI|nr:response regulator transcription factor [Halobacillus shinanisalinarum]UOQ94030.1 response regulator transcription factor [Halobacillus shinanisalinarum]
MKRLLLVDDERRMLDLLGLYLEPHGFQCDKVLSGHKALSLFKTYHYDLILLDIMMIDMDGFETCRRIREITDIPIIMITAKDQKQDILRGLKAGADDYITKPFDEDIMLARIQTQLRRGGKKQNVWVYDRLIWNQDTYQLLYLDKEINVTPKEFQLIGLLMKRPNHVYDREHLLELIWGSDSETESRTIDSHVRNIREKIRQKGFPIDKHLKTVWGIGYKWVS